MYVWREGPIFRPVWSTASDQIRPADPITYVNTVWCRRMLKRGLFTIVNLLVSITADLVTFYDHDERDSR